MLLEQLIHYPLDQLVVLDRFKSLNELEIQALKHLENLFSSRLFQVFQQSIFMCLRQQLFSYLLDRSIKLRNALLLYFSDGDRIDNFDDFGILLVISAISQPLGERLEFKQKWNQVLLQISAVFDGDARLIDLHAV